MEAIRNLMLKGSMKNQITICGSVRSILLNTYQAIT